MHATVSITPRVGHLVWLVAFDGVFFSICLVVEKLRGKERQKFSFSYSFFFFMSDKSFEFNFSPLFVFQNLEASFH